MSLALRIYFCNTDIYKRIQTDENKPIKEVIVELKEKFSTDSHDYSLFVPENKEAGEKGFWLDESRTLQSYSIRANTTLHFKKKFRPLKIKLIDGTVKLIIIDESFTVKDLAVFIGEKIGLKSTEEFSLRYPTPPEMSKAPHWLNENQTLLEQSIPEDQILEFAKKLYFSDGYIDANDPFTLHLLFVEANHAIVEGKYPVSAEQARDCAALQMQITYGDHNVEKHSRPGFIDPATFLPKQFRKDPKMIKDILSEHRKLVGTKEMQAKLRYVQYVRGLKTYGITFFECQLKVKSKKGVRFVPTLIGITREKIMNVSPENQEVIKEWKWSQMRRWSSVKGGGLTLDFGDYEGDYVTVFTDESEAMSALIAGYIDMILKNRADVARAPEDDDSLVAHVTDQDYTFALTKPGQTDGSPASIATGLQQESQLLGNQFAFDHPEAHAFGIQHLPKSHRLNIVDLPSALQAVESLVDEVPSATGQPANITEKDWAQFVDDHRKAVFKDIDEILGHATLGPGRISRETLEPIAKQLVIDLRNLGVAATGIFLLNPSKRPVMDSTVALASSVADMLRLVEKTLAGDLPTIDDFETALEAVTQEIRNAQLLIENAHLIVHHDHGANLLLIQSIHNIDTTFDTFLDTVRSVASTCFPTVQEQLLSDVAKLATVHPYAVQNLQNLAPHILDPKVRQQLNITQSKLDGLRVTSTQNFLSHLPTSHKGREQVVAAAELLTSALTNLLQSSNSAEKIVFPPEANIHSPALKMLEILQDFGEDPKQVQQDMKTLNALDKDLAGATQVLSEYLDKNAGNRLTLASAQLSGGLKTLVGTVKQSQNNLEGRDHLTVSTQALEERCHLLLEDFGKMTALNELRYNAKVNTASLMKLVNESQKAIPLITNPTLKKDMEIFTSKIRSYIPSLLSAVCGASAQPNHFPAQMKLLEIAKKIVPVCSELATTAKKAARYIDDKGIQQDLDISSNETNKNLHNLMKSINEIREISGESEQDVALTEFDAVIAEYETANYHSSNGTLHQMPAQTRENAHTLLDMGVKQLKKLTKEIEGAAKQGVSAQLIKQTAQTNAQIAVGLRSLASTSSDPANQKKILGSGRDVVDSSMKFVTVARSAAAEPKEYRQELEKAKKQLDTHIAELVGQIQKIEETEIHASLVNLKIALDNLKPTGSTADISTIKEEMVSAAKVVSSSVSQLLTSAHSKPVVVPTVTKSTTASVMTLLDLATIAAGLSNENESASLLAVARELADSMLKLIPAVQVMSQKHNNAYAQKVNQEAEAVQDALNSIMQKLGKPNYLSDISNQIDKLMEEVNSRKITCLPGSREDVLVQINDAGKELKKLQETLLMTIKSGDPKLESLSQDLLVTFGKMITEAKSAENSSDSGECNLVDSLRIIKGIDVLLKHPEDLPKVHAIAKQVNRAVANIITLAKASAYESDPKKQALIVKGTQLLIDKTTQFLQSVQATSQNSTKSIEDMKNTAKELKTVTISLDSLFNKNSAHNHTIAPSIANVITGGVKKLATTYATTFKTMASIMDSNSQSKMKKVSDLLEGSFAETDAEIDEIMKICGSANKLTERCEKVTQTLLKTSSEIEAMAMLVIKGSQIPVKTNLTIKELQVDGISLGRSIALELKEILQISTPEQIIPSLAKMEEWVPKLTKEVQALSASIPEAPAQAHFLTVSKFLVDNLVEFVDSIKALSLNDPQARTLMMKNSNSSAKALGLLVQQIQSNQQISDGLEKSIQSIIEALKPLSTPSTRVNNYADVREALVAVCKKLYEESTALFTSDKHNQTTVSVQGGKLAELVPHMVNIARVCAASTTKDLSEVILTKAQNVGDTLVSFITTVKEVCENPTESKYKQLLDVYSSTNQAISQLLSAGKQAATTEIEIERAHEAIMNEISRIGASDILSRGGQLFKKDLKNQDLSLEVTKSAKKLASSVAQIKNTPVENIGKVSLAIASDLSALCDVTINSTSIVPDTVAQRDILTAAKELSFDIASLFISAKNTQIGTKIQRSNAHKEFSNFHRSVISRLNNLVAALQISSKESSRGEKFLEMMKQRIISLLEDIPMDNSATPESTIKAAKEIVSSASQFVFATEPERIIDTAKALFGCTERFLQSSVGIAHTYGVKELSEAAVETAQLICSILEIGKQDRKVEGAQQKLEAFSANITKSLKKFTSILKTIEGAEGLELEDSSANLDRMIEEELNKSSSIIDNLSSKVSALSSKELIGRAIIESAKAITNATKTLMQSAAQLQAERIHIKTERERAGGRRVPVDPLWSTGLISASQELTRSVEEFYEVSIAFAGGKGDEGKVVEKAKAVGLATGRLVTASRLQTDQHSDAQKKFQNAASAVTAATNQLAEAVAAVHTRMEEEMAMKIDQSEASLKVKELEQKMKIMKLEKEMERERRKLLNMRKTKQLQ